jgi:hypothetical protein
VSSSTSSARERKTKTKRTNDDNGLEIKPMDSALRVQVMAFKNNQKFSSIVFLAQWRREIGLRDPRVLYICWLSYLFIIISENLTWK